MILSQKYISDIVDLGRVDPCKLNLIVSSCGSGKTYFCANTLLERLPGQISPGEVLFVTSRSLAANQLVRGCESSEMFDIKDLFLRNSWMGLDDMAYLADRGIQVTTYDKVIRLLRDDGYDALDNVRLIVLDECHTIFSDTFIHDIEMFKLWVFGELASARHIFIGLTATPRVMCENRIWGDKINMICEPLYKYRAKNMWIVNFENLPEFVNRYLTDGKTIIMCRSFKQGCEVLYNSLPKSSVLVSRSNKNDQDLTYYDFDNMDNIRKSIIESGTLPDDVNVLISTSTIREGFNILPESNVRNIVCCANDELEIIQLLGRCRYDVDNLVIVKGQSVQVGNADYKATQTALFEDFLNNVSDTWFDQLRSVVSCEPEDIQMFESDTVSLRKVRDPSLARKRRGHKFVSKVKKTEFKNYIQDKWLICDGMSDVKVRHRKIDTVAKKEIVDKAKDIGIFGNDSDMYTFTRVVNLLPNEFGWTVNNNLRERDADGRQYRYCTIME